MEPTDSEHKICSFLEKKIDLFNQYRSTTKRMKESLQNKQATDLRALIAQRQHCIQSIENVDLSIARIIKSGAHGLTRVSDRVKKGIDDYLKDLIGMMETINRMDKELTVLVKEEGDRMKSGLLKIQKARHAAKGYGKGLGRSTRLLDTKR